MYPKYWFNPDWANIVNAVAVTVGFTEISVVALAVSTTLTYTAVTPLDLQ